MPPKIRETHLRYSHYYLELALNNLDKWELIELEWRNIRKAQEWVNQESEDKYLIQAYGELGWLLLDNTIKRIANLHLYYTEAIEKATLDNQSRNEQAILEAIQKLNADFAQQLSDIVSSQKEIQSSLNPSILASGSGSVAAANIINSTIYTGDVVHRRRSYKPKLKDKLQAR